MSEHGWLAECQTCPTTTDPRFDAHFTDIDPDVWKILTGQE